MTQQDLQQFITPSIIDLGTLADGDVREVKIENNSPFEFECFELSCGCIGELTLQKTLATVKVTASTVGTNSGTYMLLKIGDRYAQLHHTPNGPKFYDPINKNWIDNEDVPENPEKVAVFSFSHTITLYMNDGQPIYRIKETGQLEMNPEKSRLYIPVRYLAVKDN